MHAWFVKCENLQSFCNPLILFLFSFSINKFKSFQACSKLMKARKGNKRLSCQGFTKLRKRRKSKRKLFPTIFSLPNDLITEVLARVAACSVYDFLYVKLSCKIFQQITDDKYKFQHVSLEKFPVSPWCSTKQAFFLEKCKESGHSEALYSEGVVEYFSFARVEEGVKCLNKAVKAGHLGASYVLGVILLCAEKPEEEQKGRQLLNYVKSGKGISESRKKLNDIIKAVWLKRFLEPKPNCCPMQDQHRRSQGWPCDNENDVDCEACGCNLEVTFVCNLLRGIMTC